MPIVLLLAAGPAKAHDLGYKIGVDKIVALRAELQAELDRGSAVEPERVEVVVVHAFVVRGP